MTRVVEVEDGKARLSSLSSPRPLTHPSNALSHHHNTIITTGGGSSSSGSAGLLSLPMAELKRRVEKRRYARMALQRAVGPPSPAASPSPKKKGQGDGEEEDMEEEETGEGKEKKEATPAQAPKAAADAGRREREQLWVHRYSPSAFPHLLSDEAINREVLRLVRSWDEFVFKRALPKTLLEPTTASAATGAAGGSYNKGNNKNWRSPKKQQQQQKEQERKEEAVDPATKRDRRPKVRAILLCGPPGTHARMPADSLSPFWFVETTAPKKCPNSSRTRVPLSRHSPIVAHTHRHGQDDAGARGGAALRLPPLRDQRLGRPQRARPPREDRESS